MVGLGWTLKDIEKGNLTHRICTKDRMTEIKGT